MRCRTKGKNKNFSWIIPLHPWNCRYSWNSAGQAASCVLLKMSAFVVPCVSTDLALTGQTAAGLIPGAKSSRRVHPYVSTAAGTGSCKTYCIGSSSLIETLQQAHQTLEIAENARYSALIKSRWRATRSSSLLGWTFPESCFLFQPSSICNSLPAD